MTQEKPLLIFYVDYLEPDFKGLNAVYFINNRARGFFAVLNNQPGAGRLFFGQILHL